MNDVPANNGSTSVASEGSRPAEGSRPVPLSDRVRSLRLPDKVHKPGGGIAWLPWSLCVVLAASTAYLAYENYHAPAAETEQQAGDNSVPSRPANSSAPSLPNTGAAAPQLPPGATALESKGYIIPVHQIQVSPKVSGMVIELNFEEGMRVKEGFILAKLETTEYQAEYDRVLAVALAAKHRMHELSKYREDEIRQAKAELDDAVAQQEQLYMEFRRNSELRAVNVVSPKDYELSESAYKSQAQRVKRLEIAKKLLEVGPRDERIAAAKAELAQAEAELVKAKWKLDNTIVRAPVSGTILSKKAEKGNMVNPAAFSNGLSASLCDMADLSDMEVDLAIAERDIGKLFKGQKCRVKAEAFPERTYSGFVSRLMPTADRAKGAVPVRVKIDIPREEEGRYLRPEMGAVVTFLAKE
jgi:multidrug resistance efflux pump